MKIRLLVVGKTEDSYLRAGISDYEGRINKYLRFSIEEIPGLKNAGNLSKADWKAKEGEKILKGITSSDFVILLDEKGKEMTSKGFASFLEKKFAQSSKTLTFVVGGPYGFDDLVLKKSDISISLSKMTFSHQMVRLFFVEQLYRALTILRNESYHHE